MTALSALPRVLALGALLAFLFFPQAFAPVFAPLAQNGAPAIYAQASLLDLALSHLRLVALATTASAIVAIGLGILATRRMGEDFLPLSRAVVNIGQTFPPVAVLAVAAPLVGFGEAPTLIALFVYGLLPIFENTLGGLQQVPATVVESARGAGMSPLQRLMRIELPLAAPQIFEGVRLSTVIAIGTATIGSTVAAKGLGEVIIAGLLSDNTAFVAQGGLVVGVMAVLIYDGMTALERIALRRLGVAPP